MRASDICVGDRIRLVEGGGIYTVLKAGAGERFVGDDGLLHQRLLVQPEKGGMVQDIFPVVDHEIENQPRLTPCSRCGARVNGASLTGHCDACTRASATVRASIANFRQRRSERCATVNDLVDAVQAVLDILTHDTSITIPDRETVDRVLREQFIESAHGGHPAPYFRLRSANPKTAQRDSRGFRGFFNWHRSGGSLEGLFCARWEAGDAAEAMETLAQVVLAVAGARSTAVEAWQRTGIFGSGR
jgi:hypothetical protein